MDELIKELVEDFKKQEKKDEKDNKGTKIVAKVNKNGCVKILGISGNQVSLLSTICLILREMEKYSDDSAEDMAMMIAKALEMEKKK